MRIRVNRLKDVHIAKKGGSGKKQEAGESQGVVNYIASCEKKWTELARNSFNNNELFQVSIAIFDPIPPSLFELRICKRGSSSY